MVNKNMVKVVQARVDGVNLSHVRDRLRTEHKWTMEFASRVEREYRRFLVMLAFFDHVVPLRMVDLLWHAHILDTRKYARDCDVIFGKFMHHAPTYTEAAREVLQYHLAQTASSYVGLFHEPYPRTIDVDEGERCRCDGCGTERNGGRAKAECNGGFATIAPRARPECDGCSGDQSPKGAAECDMPSCDSLIGGGVRVLAWAGE